MIDEKKEKTLHIDKCFYTYLSFFKKRLIPLFPKTADFLHHQNYYQPKNKPSEIN